MNIDSNRLYHGYYLDEYEKGLFDKLIHVIDVKYQIFVTE